MREEFRDIKDFEGVYKISSLGRVLSVGREISCGRQLCDKIIAYNINNKKYLYVDLWDSKNKKLCKSLVHKLMAETFIPNDDPINKKEVGHKNGIRTDNRLENLEWQTSKFNLEDRHARQREFKEVLKAQKGMKIIENKKEESIWQQQFTFLELFGL